MLLSEVEVALYLAAMVRLPLPEKPLQTAIQAEILDALVVGRKCFGSLLQPGLYVISFLVFCSLA